MAPRSCGCAWAGRAGAEPGTWQPPHWSPTVPGARLSDPLPALSPPRARRPGVCGGWWRRRGGQTDDERMVELQIQPQSGYAPFSHPRCTLHPRDALTVRAQERAPHPLHLGAIWGRTPLGTHDLHLRPCKRQSARSRGLRRKSLRAPPPNLLENKVLGRNPHSRFFCLFTNQPRVCGRTRGARTDFWGTLRSVTYQVGRNVGRGTDRARWGNQDPLPGG